jgi:excisionase family DNA binding protein
MARAKQPTSNSAAQREANATSINGPLGDVLTLAEAAAYLKLTEAEVLRLVHDQTLPARRLANEWRFFKAAIQQWLATPPPPGSRAAILSVAGAWKDDPDADEELKEILKRRGGPNAEQSE